MKIGYACISLTTSYTTNRKFMLKNFSEHRFLSATKENLQDLLEILKANKQKGILLFRISSDIIPFASHKINNIKWWEIFEEDFLEIGKYIKYNSMRVSMHPGQYTVLNSINEETVKRAIEDIEYHVRVLDYMQLDYSHKVVVHVGGIYGDKKAAMKRFKENFMTLSNSAKNRLTLENDDKSYTISDVLEICKDIRIPSIFDVFHHKCNPSIGSIQDIMFQVESTWEEKDGKSKIHYSNKDENKKLGSHSLFINSKEFVDFYNIIKDFDPDIMLEVKDKDISAIKCTNIINSIKKMQQKSEEKNILTTEWARYKYLVMEKDYSLYKKASNLVKEEGSIVDFYNLIDEVCSMPYDEGNFKNAAEHLWGYFKHIATDREKQEFTKLLNNFDDYKKVKMKLKKLAEKYKENYILQSYYFRDV